MKALVPFSCFFAAASIAGLQASAAWMIVVTGYTTPNSFKKEFSTIEDCEFAAEHILRVRNSNKPTSGVVGSWKTNYNFSRPSEPALTMLCVPSSDEMDRVQQGLKKKGWFRDLNN